MDTILTCRALSKDWGDVQALSDVTLELPQAAVLAVVGPNGAGKSTWLQVVAGLVPPTAGGAWVAGVPVHENPRGAHEHIGYLPDFYGISARLTVQDYLHYFALSYELAPEIIPVRIAEIMKNLDLSDLGDRYVRQLSRGQKQRVAIGRALINNPKLLLLDEPVAGLDPKARIEFNGLISLLAGQGMTIVVSSHILTELEDYSTHVAIFEKGKLIRFEDLKKREAGLKATRILCRFTGDKAAAENFFKRENISYLATDPTGFEISAQMNHAQAAEFLTKLASARLGLYHFEHLQTRIEDTYLETFKKGQSK